LFPWYITFYELHGSPCEIRNDVQHSQGEILTDKVLSVQIFQKWYVVWEIVECHQCPRRPYMFLFMWVMEMLCWIFDNSRVLSVTASAIFQMLTWSALLLFNLNLAFVHSHFHDTEVICISSIWLSLLAKMLETLDTLIKSVVIWQFLVLAYKGPRLTGE
jgi:hypothetical protein